MDCGSEKSGLSVQPVVQRSSRTLIGFALTVHRSSRKPCLGVGGTPWQAARVDTVLNVPTSVGEARAIVAAPDGSLKAVLVLGHGASGGIQAPDLAALARHLPGRGVTVVRVEQPWRVAGKKVAPRPPVLDQAWLEIIPALRVVLDLEAAEPARRHSAAARSRSATRRRAGGAPRLIVGGRSAGARVACRTALRTGAAGALALSFPLHPPGRPERSRAGELLEAGVPTLVIQGERDPFGRPEEFPEGPYDLVPVPAADHGLAVPKNAAVTRAEALVVTSTTTWINDMLD
jgi:uncharacterized protein